jgi:molybdopterin-guanine dinucleotide biosynthesis protein B
MHKCVAVVGGKHSGKTTVIENVLRQLKTRGYRVGVVKEMVRIPTLDAPEKETNRYGEAGAETIVAIPRSETVIFFKNRLSLGEVLSHLQGLDYVLLEGFESEKKLPRIVAAKTSEEAAQFCDGLTVALSGLILESETETAKAAKLGVPMLSSTRQAEKLADIVQQRSINMEAS